MKSRRASTRTLRCEALERRLALSVVPGLSAAVASHAIHTQPAAVEVAKTNTTIAPISNVSSNWSGYAVTGTSVSYVAGSWTVPTVSTNTNGYSAVWVGIDGYSSSTVEQIGTGEDVVNGKASYYAWYEMYPSASITIATTTKGTAFIVKPGDSISGSVAYSAAKKDFVLTITDASESESFSTTLTAKAAALSSAEWIVEAPSSNYGVLPLANFGAVAFSNAYATVNGTTAAIDNWQSYAINIQSRSTLEASTGSLSDTTAPSADGFSGSVSSFTVTYAETSIVTPTPTPTPTPPPATPTPPQRHHHGWGGSGGWDWDQTELASQVAVGHGGGSSQVTSLADHIARDQLFATSEVFDLLHFNV